MSQSFADRLVKSIELSGHKQVHLAKKLEISKQAVNQWAQGKSVPSMHTIEQIAKFLNVDFLWLLSGAGVEPVAETIKKQLENAPMVGESDFRFYTASFIPVVRMPGITIEETLKEDNIVGRYPVPEACINGRCFAVEVTGDMMVPLIKNGDVALIDVEETATSGDIVCVVMKGKYLIRYLDEIREDGVVLRPANSLYPVVRIRADEILKIYRINEACTRTKF